jgi:UDP-GlcNAc:undecaprenyl-phosphate GlcNAc-1-phosphate transferase
MTDPWVACPLAVLVALALTQVLTPLCVRLARATGFMDHPAGYKGHRAPTPYLGGVAVLVAFLATGAALSGDARRYLPIFACTALLAVVGLVDDRRTVSPLARVAVEVAAGVEVWHAGLGWTMLGYAPLDMLVTVVWVVGLVNAVNLMDNQDGAASSVCSAAAVGAGIFALANGETSLAILSFGLAGATAGFLRFNLARPSRIFLGDGGSMPLGFLVAVLVMNVADVNRLRGTAMLAAAMFVALPILDTTLVVISRRRRGVSFLTPGRDHLTHRLLQRLGTPRRVAAALAGAQIVLAVFATVGESNGQAAVLVLASVTAVAGLAFIALMESPDWHPLRESRDPGRERQSLRRRLVPQRLDAS